MPCPQPHFLESRFAYEFKRDLSYFSRFVDARTHRADFVCRAIDLGCSLFGMCPPVTTGQSATILVAVSEAETLGIGFQRGLLAQGINATIHRWNVGEPIPDIRQDMETGCIYFVLSSLATLDIDVYMNVMAAKSPHTRVIISALTISNREIEAVRNNVQGRFESIRCADKGGASDKPLFVGHDWDNSIDTGEGSDFEINRARLAELFH